MQAIKGQKRLPSGWPLFLTPNKAKMGSIGFLLLLGLNCGLMAQGNDAFDPFYQPASSGDLLQDYNFYALTLIEREPQFRRYFEENAGLKESLRTRLTAVEAAVDKRGLSSEQLARMYSIHDEEKIRWMQILRQMLEAEGELSKSLAAHLQRSGRYALFENQAPVDFILECIALCITGLNTIIDAYALGIHGLYPRIDSVSFDINGEVYPRYLALLNNAVSEDARHISLFFQPSLRFTMALLKINGRDEAVRFEPMEHGENRKAWSYIRSIVWDDYPYALLLVPGSGVMEGDQAISYSGVQRCRLAAVRFHQRLAPLIVVSGGFVHPYKTPYCEAFEMKKVLVEEFGVPGQAIIIEPHARHTTTNFRNTVRLALKYGIPTDIRSLCTTTADQSYYISNMNLDERCKRELGYVPFVLHERISRYDIEFQMNTTSLHRNPVDPLDP